MNVDYSPNMKKLITDLQRLTKILAITFYRHPTREWVENLIIFEESPL